RPAGWPAPAGRRPRNRRRGISPPAAGRWKGGTPAENCAKAPLPARPTPAPGNTAASVPPAFLISILVYQKSAPLANPPKLWYHVGENEWNIRRRGGLDRSEESPGFAEHGNC